LASLVMLVYIFLLKMVEGFLQGH